MAKQYNTYVPSMFNSDYRTYVSNTEKSKKVKKMEIKNDIKHSVDYYNQFPTTYSSLAVVKNSHQYPRWVDNPITPYEQKQIKGSAFMKAMDDEVVYWGSHRYTRKTAPRLPEHWE